jgi:hypothetical protein
VDARHKAGHDEELHQRRAAYRIAARAGTTLALHD